MAPLRIEGIEGLSADMVEGFGGESAFSQVVGMQLDLVSPDRLEAHLAIGPQHHQPYGIVHGGVWCTVVEGLGSLAGVVSAGGRTVVGVSNKTDFIRPVSEGRVDAVATPIHRGRTQQLWLVELTRADDGKLVARGELRLQVLPDRTSSGTTDPGSDT